MPGEFEERRELAAIRYCPMCAQQRETFDGWIRGLSKPRCRICGCPADEGAPDEKGIPETSSGFLSSRKVLLIDDVALQRELFMDAMAAAGYQALVAADGPTGIAMATQKNPEVIFVDVVMPEMDGYEVCRQLRTLTATRETPIVLFTGESDPQLNLKAFQVGADFAVAKTFQAGKLNGIITTLLWLKSQQKEGRKAG